jgi:hypothetical protein
MHATGASCAWRMCACSTSPTKRALWSPSRSPTLQGAGPKPPSSAVIARPGDDQEVPFTPHAPD